jgi:hypothetical protein
LAVPLPDALALEQFDRGKCRLFALRSGFTVVSLGTIDKSSKPTTKSSPELSSSQ